MKGEYTILLVDDSERDRGIYRRYLLTSEGFDYQILETGSLKEGLELWRSQSPDLVLTDINLADGSGLELLETIAETPSAKKTPIIVITGQGNERIAVQSMKLGAKDYLVKEDLTQSAFCRAIGNVLEKSTLAQQVMQLEKELEVQTAALKFSEDRLRAIFDNTLQFIGLISTDGHVLEVNQTALTGIGLQRQEVVGRLFWETDWFQISTETQKRLRESVMRAAKGEFIRYEMDIWGANQRVIAVDFSLRPIFNELGQVIYLIPEGRDITEAKALALDRQRALAALEVQTNFNRNILDTIPDLLLRLGRDGTCLSYMPPKVQRENFEPISQHISEFLPPDLVERQLQVIEQAIATGELQVYEHQVLKNNQIAYEEVRILAINDQTVLAVVRDISDRKAMEKTLEESRIKLQRLIDNLGEKFVVFSLSGIEGILDYVSDGIYPIFGLIKEDILGKHWADVVNWLPEELPMAEQRIIAMAQGQINFDQPEMRFIHPNGDIRTIQVSELPVRNEAGEMIAIEGIIENISDRKQTELEKQQLLQELSAFKSALDRSAIVAITDVKGAINYANDLFCEVSGYSRAELIGQTHRIVSSGYHPDYFFQNLWRTIREGKIWQGEICNRKKNGDLYWLGSTLVPFLDEKGKAFQYLAIRFDITNRKQAEQQLQNLTDRLKIALKSGAIGCWEWEIKTNILTWDKRMYELYGIPDQSHSALIFDNWINRLHPEDLNANLTLFQQTAAGESEFDTEFRVLHPDHSIHFLKAYGILLRDPQGNPQRMIGVNFDITAQKQAEQTIRQQIEKETLLRQITQHIRETLDLQRIFETACQDIRQFIQSDRVGIFRFYPESGYDDGEFVAESLKEGFPSVLAVQVHDHCFGEDYAQRYTEGHFQAIDDVLHSDLQDCHKAVLSQFEIRANLVIPLVRGGKLWGLLCIHTCTAPRIWQADEINVIQQIAGQLAIAIQQADLFEQLQQEQEKLTETNQALAHSNEDLARATRLKDEFLANMSHELRTPLTAILGMSEALQTDTYGEINPGQEKAIKLIEKSGSHLLSLINDILDLSKIEAGKLELEFSSSSIQNLCENSTIFVRQMAFTKKIELQTRIAENIDPIWVDELRIRQSLINLLSNAIKFTPPDGKVTLSVELEEKEILFSVTDTGIGISPDNLDKLFQPFVQIDSSLNRQSAGTGLGLVLVERIITKHGGRVVVTSRAGEGSCFTLRLPYAPLPKEFVPEMLQTSSLSTQQNNLPLSVSPLILLADDDNGNRQTLEDYLTNKGYRMLLAYNGKEALEMVKNHQPDLILMDIQMPEMDGLEATTLIRSDSAIAHIPIIAITALALPGQADQFLKAGFDEYLVKPVRFKLLIETIQKFCQK